MQRSTFAGAATLVAFLMVLGCKRGTPAEALRPHAPTGAEALGSESAPGSGSGSGGGKGKCTAVEDYGKPLVIDLKGEERGDFEVAMKEGIAVVTYDCNTLRLVDGCNVRGTYGFVGLSPKEELVRLENSDELKANLPISAGAFGAKIGAEMQRGMTLDIAMMMVGKRRTTLRSTTRGDLLEDRGGACKRATHFVRGATIGAFAMETGSKAKARTAAELLGIPMTGSVGVGAGSSASRNTSSRDGSVEECKQASPDAPNAPPRCGALLRLELTAIDPEGVAGKSEGSGGHGHARAPGDDEDAPACPTGYVLTAGKCAARGTAASHRCASNDPADCEAQCEKGDAASCSTFGALVGIGRAGKPDSVRAASFFKKACDSGWEPGCGSLGALQMVGDGVPKDVERGLAAVQKACFGGSMPMCELGGVQLAIGRTVPKDRVRAAPLLKRACEGGLATSCAFYGEYLTLGDGGLAKDATKGVGFMRRACDGGEPLGCIGWAQAAVDGNGITKDEKGAAAALKAVCEGSTPMAPEGCGRLGLLTMNGRGVPRDEARANQLLQKACASQPRWCQAAKNGGAPASAKGADAAPSGSSSSSSTSSSASVAPAVSPPHRTPRKKKR